MTADRWEEWPDGRHALRAPSGYVVARVFPSAGVLGRWAWAVEHVPTGRWFAGRADTMGEAQDAAVACLAAARTGRAP